MPEVFPTRIISFSSEDKAFPASNLLKKSSFSKWKSERGGNKQEVVEFDFGQPVEFSRLDVGNNGSAFVEVLVRRSASSEEPTIFLPSASFMSPVEAKNETHLNRVRVFSRDNLSQSAINQKWDIIKFICSQPFNKTMQFGLSFVSFHSPTVLNDSQAKSSIINIPSQSVSKIPIVSAGLLEDDGSSDSDLKPGSLFLASKFSSNSKNENETHSPLSVGEKIRAANTSSSPVAAVRSAISATSPKVSTSQQSTPTVRSDAVINSPQTSVPAKSKDSASKNKSSTPVPSTSSSTTATTSGAGRGRTANKNSPMSGVVFTLSGYQNPLRSQIRDKALRLGASFRQDWSDDCTHLVCAFPNTPKFSQVKGLGIIVSDKWISRCHDTGSLVDWRPYRVGRAPSPKQLRSAGSTHKVSASRQSTGGKVNSTADSTSHSSETDSSPASQKRRRSLHRARDDDGDDDEWRIEEADDDGDDDDDDDDDDESEDSGSGAGMESDDGVSGSKSDQAAAGAQKRSRSRLSTKMARKRTHGLASDNDECPEEQDTDDEIEKAISGKKSRIDQGGSTEAADEKALELPDFFDGKHFFIHNKSIPSDEERLLRRLIVAFAGTLHPYMHPEVQFVVTRSSWSSEFDEALATNAGLVFVLPDWILACDQEAACLAYNDFLVSH